MVKSSPGLWYDSSTVPDSSVVYSRIRLSRNTSEFPFVHRLEKLESARLLARAERYIRSFTESETPFLDISEAGQVLQKSFVSADQGLGILVNHIDHFRLWSCVRGLQLSACLEAVLPIERSLEKSFHIAASLELGYLSPLLNNLGTSLSVRTILHLPGLSRVVENEALAAGIDGASDASGISLEPLGAHTGLFVLRNTETLGIDENSILNKLAGTAQLLLHYELDASTLFYTQNPILCEDTAWRALAIMQNCRTIDIAEAWKLLGDLRLGFNAGVFASKPLKFASAAGVGAALLSAMPPWASLSDPERASVFRQSFRIEE